jgi:ATP-dependent DNA helicase RecG
MVDTDDRFVLAQPDLELRGPGDFLGTRQSVLPELSWLTDGFDTRVLDEARRAAEQTLAEDSDLSLPHHKALRAELNDFWERAGVGLAP